MTMQPNDDKVTEREAAARSDNPSVSEVAEPTIADRIEARRKDKAFRARLKRMVDQNATATC
jgi:hypothetical protein